MCNRFVTVSNQIDVSPCLGIGIAAGVELPQMTVYMKFSDRVHLFLDRVHFFVMIVSYVLYVLELVKYFPRNWNFPRILAPAQRAAGGCSPLKATPGRVPPLGENFFRAWLFR